MRVSVIVPCFNEEKNIRQVVSGILTEFDHKKIEGEIICVNDGSSDSTEEAISSCTRSFKNVRNITHAKNLGIGASFWDGVSVAKGEFVVMIPGDNENSSGSILEWAQTEIKYDIIVPYIVNTSVRSVYRRILSTLFIKLINSLCRTTFKYTNGTVLYKKAVLQQIKIRRAGFFYQTDALVRAVAGGATFLEVPSHLRREQKGRRSNALKFSVLSDITKDFVILLFDLHVAKTIKNLRFKPSS
jgi:glycosyltransferase involved in cell wall biosynthesis